MPGIEDMVVHVNDDALSANAVDLASRLAAECGARLSLLLPVPPAVEAGRSSHSP